MKKDTLKSNSVEVENNVKNNSNNLEVTTENISIVDNASGENMKKNNKKKNDIVSITYNYKDNGELNNNEKLFNKYRKLNKTHEFTEKEVIIINTIKNLILSHNDNMGYVFTLNTIRKEFFNCGIVTEKQRNENLEKLANGKHVTWSKEYMDSKSWINDDIIFKLCGYISLDENINVSILPKINNDGILMYQRVKDNEFFSYSTLKKNVENKEEFDIDKFSIVASEFSLSTINELLEILNGRKNDIIKQNVNLIKK